MRRAGHLTRELAVARHVPQREPDHGAGERVVEPVQVRGGERERLVVEAQLRVRQVVVVREQELRARLAGDLTYGVEGDSAFADTVRGLLSGSLVLEGLELDNNFRWSLV